MLPAKIILHEYLLTFELNIAAQQIWAPRVNSGQQERDSHIANMQPVLLSAEMS